MHTRAPAGLFFAYFFFCQKLSSDLTKFEVILTAFVSHIDDPALKSLSVGLFANGVANPFIASFAKKEIWTNLQLFSLEKPSVSANGVVKKMF